MEQAKHTPGPWKLFENETTYEGGMPIRATDPTDDCVFRVADVYGVYIDTKHCAQAKANARLIAAAPELLDALEALEEAASYAGIENIAERFAVADALNKARAAITKATVA